MDLLSPESLAAYRRDGFTTHPTFFDADEVALMRAELDRLMAEGLLRNVATDGDGATISRTVANLQICPLSPKSPVFRTLPFAAKVRAQVQAILGPTIALRLDQIFLKPAHHGVGTNWHQDNAYFRDGADAKAVHGLGMWIALHDATVANGCMHVIPGAFAQTAEHRRDGGSNHHITLVEVDESKAVPIELPAGGVLFFNWGVPHCPKANTTDRPRAGLALHFQDLHLGPPSPGHPLRAIVLGPQACRDHDGAWEDLVAGVGATRP